MALSPNDPDLWVKFSEDVKRMERVFLAMCIIVVVVIGFAAVLSLLDPQPPPAAPLAPEYRPRALR